jgi:hypothetical protein
VVHTVVIFGFFPHRNTQSSLYTYKYNTYIYIYLYICTHIQARVYYISLNVLGGIWPEESVRSVEKTLYRVICFERLRLLL